MKFSLVVPIFNRPLPLLRETLEAANQQKEIELEIFPIIAHGNQRIDELLERYDMQRIEANEPRMDAMVQQGLELATGDYVHVLLPGEYYLSHYSLQCLAEFIEESEKPDVIMCGRLDRGRVYFDTVSKKALRSGTYPLSMQNYLFKQTLFERLGPFDVDYQYRGRFDFFCRIALQGIQPVCFKRVITDCHRLHITHDLRLQEGKEMLLILQQRFGFGAAFKWWFTRNQLDFFRAVWLTLKKAFLAKA